MTTESTRAVTCDCCDRSVAEVRGSPWHGNRRICLACFFVWYDPNDNIDVTKPDEIKAAVLAAEEAGRYPFTMSPKLGLDRVT